MFVLIPTLTRPLSTQFLPGLVLQFCVVPPYGAAAEIPADREAEARARVRGLAPRYRVADEDEAQDIATLLGRPSRTASAAPASASGTWADQEAAQGTKVPLWVLQGARNGWNYADLTGGETPDDGEGASHAPCRCGLTPAQVMLCSPPPGWAERAAHILHPWQMPGFSPPPGFVAPTSTPVVVPVVEPVAEVDDRFSEPTPPTEDESAPTPSDDVEVSRAGAADIDAVVKEIATRTDKPFDDVKAAVLLVLDMPKPETGGNVPRGKANIALRSRRLPTFSEQDYGLLTPLFTP